MMLPSCSITTAASSVVMSSVICILQSSVVKFWDEYEQRITFDDDTLVKANEIIDIKGELFDNRAF